MANEQNLRPCEHKLTQEEQKKGGKKSAEVRSLRSAVKKILKTQMPEGFDQIKEVLTENGIDTNNYSAIAMAMVIGALQQNKNCADWVRDTGGEKPKDEIDLSGGVNVSFVDDLK